jgi:hypothetical protein
MKIARKDGGCLVALLPEQEKDLLVRLLELYPCVPPARQKVSKTAPPDEARSAQELLDEALAEQRAENRKQIRAWIADPERFKLLRTRYQLTLAVSEVEWLLQVLNDIRVGNWLMLGSPEDLAANITEDNARCYFAMEACGVFQMQLLHALEAGGEGR